MAGSWRLVALVTQLGLTMVFSILIGLGLGLWLDAELGTRPLATLIFTLIGVTAGSLGIYRLVSAAIEQAEQEWRRPGSPSSRRDYRDDKEEDK